MQYSSNTASGNKASGKAVDGLRRWRIALGAAVLLAVSGGVSSAYAGEGCANVAALLSSDAGVADAFSSKPLKSKELAGTRGAGLDAAPAVEPGETRVAVVLWDEFRRPVSAGGMTSHTDTTGSQIGSTLNGAAF